MKQFNYFLLAIITFGFIVQSCAPEEPVPDTKIVLSVKDAEGEPLSQTDVYLFESDDAFRAFISGQSDEYLQTGITNSDGEYTFSGLSSVEYFFFADNKGLGLSNVVEDDFRNYKLGGKLTTRATTFVTIILEEYDRKEIKFFSQDPTITGNEISVFLGTNTSTALFVISEVGADEPTNLYLPAGNGTYTFLITNNMGCVWVEEVTIDDDDSVANIELESCGETTYSFYYPEEVLSGNIEVYLNNETSPIGVITAQGSCTNNQVSVTRPSGVYTYRAVHSNGECTWFGETAGVCIALGQCE